MMTINSYITGQTAVIQGSFIDSATGLGIVAASIKLRYIDPIGTETDVNSGFANPSQGVYSWPIELLIPGTWAYRWEVTEPVSAACEGRLFVQNTRFLNPQ